MNPHLEPNMPPQPWGHHQGGLFPGAGGSGFGNNSQYMPPQRQLDSYYPPSDLPSVDKHPHQALSAYGRDAPMGVHQLPNAQPPQAVITQVVICFHFCFVAKIRDMVDNVELNYHSL